MKTAIRTVTVEQTEEATRQCKEFFNNLADALIFNGEQLKVISNFPGPKSNSIAISKIDYPIPPKVPVEKFPPIRIKIHASGTNLWSYLEFSPKDDKESPGAKRLLEEVYSELCPTAGFSHNFYDEAPTSPELAAAKLRAEVFIMRTIYERYCQDFKRIFQKELDFTAELYADEAERIIQDFKKS